MSWNSNNSPTESGGDGLVLLAAGEYDSREKVGREREEGLALAERQDVGGRGGWVGEGTLYVEGAIELVGFERKLDVWETLEDGSVAGDDDGQGQYT